MMVTTADIEALLTSPGRWAVVGLSRNQDRPAHGGAAYLRSLGHTTVPVHPRCEEVAGEPGVPDLASVEGPIDVVDLFVNSERIGPIIDQAIALRVPVFWLQLGVHDEAAEARAHAAGITVVSDTCPAIEGRRLGLPRPVQDDG